MQSKSVGICSKIKKYFVIRHVNDFLTPKCILYLV